MKDGDYLQGTVATNPLQLLTNLEGNIGEAISSVAGAGNDIGRLARRVNTFSTTTAISSAHHQQNRTGDRLVPKDYARHQRGLGRPSDPWAGGRRERPAHSQPLEEAAGSRRTRPPTAEPARTRVTTLPQLMAETRDADRRTCAPPSQTANRNMANLERFTEPLGDRGEELITKVDRSVGHLDELLQQFVMFGQALNRQEGTIGLLLQQSRPLPASQRGRLQHRNAHPANAADRRNIKIFTDKLARHPGVDHQRRGQAGARHQIVAGLER